MYQNLIVIGNVGNDAEGRFTPEGKPVTSFSVAANRAYTANGEKVKETTWFRVVTYGKLAEICGEYVKKGMLIMVNGRLTPDKSTGSPRIWTDKQGQDHASFDVTADEVKFLSRKDAAQEDMPF